MKKPALLIFLMACLVLTFSLTACQKREKAPEYVASLDGENKNNEDVLLPSKDKKDSETSTKDEEEKGEEKKDENKNTFKIENSGFEITIPKNWSATDLAAPMGAMLMRGESAENSAFISYCEGEEKRQKEKDFEQVFDGLKADTEINDYNITKNEKDGLYQILLSYNQLESDKSYVFSYVLYQQTENGLIEISFKLKDQYPNEIRDMIESVQKETENAVPMEKE